MIRMNLIVAGLLLMLAMPVQAENQTLARELQGVLESFLAENTMAPGASVWAVCPALQLDWAAAAHLEKP